MRKLASIQRIWKIEPIEGADRMDGNDAYTYGACDIRDVPEKFLYASEVHLID